MRKVLFPCLFFVLSSVLFFSSSKVAMASASTPCSIFISDPPYAEWTTSTKVSDINSITIGPGAGIADGLKLIPYVKTANFSAYYLSPENDGVSAKDSRISFKPRDPGGSNSRLTSEGTQTIVLSDSTNTNYNDEHIICSTTYTVRPFRQLLCGITDVNHPNSYGPNDKVNIEGTFYYRDVNGNETRYTDQDVDVRLFSNNQNNTQGQADLKTDGLGNFTGTREIPSIINPSDVGAWYITASPNGKNNLNEQTCTKGIYVSQKSGEKPPDSVVPLLTVGTGITVEKPEPLAPTPPCSKFSPDGSKCLAVNTAIGGIDTEPAGFIKKIFGLLLGVSGGIAVILIIVSGYRLMASQGNPEKVQGAREMLTSAIVGLLFIIFSLVILQIIGVDILKIPGFSG